MSTEICPEQAHELAIAASVKPYGVVYCATNKANGKRYVGQTIGRLYERKRGHLGDAKRRRGGYHFANALLAHGTQGFEWKVIDQAYSKNDLDDKERHWIAFYETINRDKGYNTDEGGKSQGKLAEETKRKISETKRRQYASGERKSSWVNKALSQETRTALKESAKKRFGKRLDRSRPNNRGKRPSPSTEYPSVSIRCIETSKEYSSLGEAAREFGISHTNFTAFFRGKTKSVAGLHWEKVVDSGVSSSST